MRQHMSPQKTHDYRHAVGECIRLSDLLLQICNVALTPYQREYRELLIRSALSGHALIIPIQWSRQTGKTEANVHAAIALAIYNIRWLQRNYPVAIVTPSRQEQSVVVTRVRLGLYADRLNTWLKIALGIDFALAKGRRTDDYIFVSSSGFEAPFHCVSASPSAFQKGQTYPLMFLEQVEDMDEEVMKTILFPMAAGQVLQSCRVLAGTPSMQIKNNYFFDKSRTLRYPQFVDDKFAAYWRPDYGEWVEKEKDRLGEESDEYKTQYRCVWVQARNRLTDRDQLRDLAKDYEPDPVRQRFAGTDVAKDVDSTVCTVIEQEGADHHILGWYEAHNTDYETQADELRVFLQSFAVESNMVDATGVGDPVVDMLSNRCRGICRTIPIKLMPEAHDAIWKVYEPELRHGRLHYPKTIKDEEQKRLRNRFIEQHCIADRRVIGNKIKVEKPTKKDSHIDYVISSALAVYCSARGRSSDPDAVGGG
jgi:hypothetical protein